MPDLELFLNELSVSPDFTVASSAAWDRAAHQFFQCLRAVAVDRPDLILMIPRGRWDAACGDLPLNVILSKLLHRDEYRWLLRKVREYIPPRDADSEIRFGEMSTDGLTMAHLKQSWATSFSASTDDWIHHFVDAIEARLDTGVWSEKPMSVNHLSAVAHAEHWANDLRDYGRMIAEQNVIGRIDDCEVAMYPRDHGYPHVHLVKRADHGRSRRSNTVAKYRIDVFAKLEGDPRYNSLTKEWVSAHRNDLLRSWERCQRGGHPYRIDPD